VEALPFGSRPRKAIRFSVLDVKGDHRDPLPRGSDEHRERHRGRFASAGQPYDEQMARKVLRWQAHRPTGHQVAHPAARLALQQVSPQPRAG